MRLLIEADLDYWLPEPADVLLQIEAALMPDQRIEAERLTVTSEQPLAAVAGDDGIGQRCWARAEGRMVASYRATVVVERTAVPIGALPPTPPRALPAETVPYLLPSRYCQSDRLEGFVRAEFGALQGGALAAALAAWVQANLSYQAATSSGETTALDTFGRRAGVCRDYAHLLVALARAGEIPARCVSAYAVAELWLDGAWHLVDATGMSRADEIARVVVGRDATDIAFMTVFGTAMLQNKRVAVTRG